MALTTAKRFSNSVLSRLRAHCERHSAEAALEANPFLEPALRFAAAKAYALYLRGHYGQPDAVSGPKMVASALQVARNDVLNGTLHSGDRDGWDGNTAFQTAFGDAVAAAFAEYGA